MKNTLKKILLWPTVGTAAAVLSVPTIAQAGIAGSGSSSALDVDVHAISGLLGISVGPSPAVTGTAPNPFTLSQTTLSAHASATGIASLTTGVLHATAQSDITPLSLIGATFASSQVDDLSLRIVPGLLTPDLLRLTAGTISSSAQLTYNGTQVIASGGSVLEDASLSVSGVGSLSVLASAAPNTVLLDAMGIRIVLNEQILTTVGDITTFQVNALRITAHVPLQAVHADAVFAHSSATLTVPAPGGAGFAAALLGLAVARRRRP